MRQEPVSQGTSGPDMIWANLIHLGFNMWGDGYWPGWEPHGNAKPYLRFDERLWDDLLAEMVVEGLNMVVLDVGDAVKYDSHPEISVKDAWTKRKLRSELAQMRELGLEPIPKLNFSACHDVWLSPYDRMLSTDAYYRVCADVIEEVADLFDRPRLFHLGMDEETEVNQAYGGYLAIRQHDLWWHDLYFLVDQVEKYGSRPWVWADNVWRNPTEYVKRMPKTVLQSNWYYRESFGREARAKRTHGRLASPIEAYAILDKHGFHQVPTGSNHNNDVNFARTVRHCRKVISKRRLAGFLQTPWRATLGKYHDHHLEAIGQVGTEIRRWERTSGKG